MKSFTGPDPKKFRALKEAALDLLDWSLADVSPAGHSLHLKMGFEREGHFIHPELKEWQGESYAEWNKLAYAHATELAASFNAILSRNNVVELGDVYADHAMVELTTFPDLPKNAALACVNISEEMVRLAKDM